MNESIHGERTASELQDWVTELIEQQTAISESAARHCRERQYRAMQSELAHANRVATMGQLTASIAHEISSPLRRHTQTPLLHCGF
jgi:C4-dicarboxylate-specific signal transduction histidine kinase